MEQVAVDIYSAASNQAIVRMPGRRFPGVVIQGDTLNGLLGRARDLARRAQQSNDAALREEAETLADLLGKLAGHYERVLKEYGIDLPY